MTERNRRRRRRRRRQSHWISSIILVISLAVFCIAAFQLIKIGKGYLDGRSEYEKIQDLAITNPDQDEKKGKDKSDGKDRFKVDFDKLLGMNQDTIGWIRFYPEPSIINYPVVQGKDNDEYLHKTFSANENTLGTIFLNVDNHSDFNDVHSVIYGHRMRDGSMFRHLQDYEKKEFWEENPYFYIYTPDGRKIIYHIYAAAQIVDSAENYKTVFENGEEFQQFIDMTKKQALYDTGVEVTNLSQIVTLSTCTSASDEHRFVVRAVKESEDLMDGE